jgi:hypothetical protein
VLVDAQINQIVDWRQKAKVDLDGVVVNLSKEKLMELLSVDVLAHVLDRARINVPLSELK